MLPEAEVSEVLTAVSREQYQVIFLREMDDRDGCDRATSSPPPPSSFCVCPTNAAPPLARRAWIIACARASTELATPSD